MKQRRIAKDEINKITRISPPRERAFFTFIRQSGLEISEIQKLKMRDVERILDPNPPIPCRIDTLTKSPTFIGYEAVKHLKNYLDIRARQKEKLTSESLLFTAKTDPSKEISTKRVSIVFKEKAVKIGNPDLELRSLIAFFKNSTEEYQKELKELGNDSTPKDDEFYRELYRENALPFLEIEPLTTTELHQLKAQNEELNQRLTEIENTLSRKQPEHKPTPEEIAGYEMIEQWYKRLEEHPEARKREEKRAKKLAKKHERWRKENPELAKQDDELMEAQNDMADRIFTENRLKEMEIIVGKALDVIKELRKGRQKPTRNVSPRS